MDSQGVETRKTPMRTAKQKREIAEKKKTTKKKQYAGYNGRWPRSGMCQAKDVPSSPLISLIEWEKSLKCSPDSDEYHNRLQAAQANLELFMQAKEGASFKVSDEIEFQAVCKHFGLDSSKLLPRCQSIFRVEVISACRNLLVLKKIPDLFHFLIEANKADFESDKPSKAEAKIIESQRIELLKIKEQQRLQFEEAAKRARMSYHKYYNTQAEHEDADNHEEEEEDQEGEEEEEEDDFWPVSNPFMVPMRRKETSSEYLKRIGVDVNPGRIIDD